ncbi:MAG: TonB-dependent receptor [Chitinophagaceae bacterium]|nr:TonB-dependent receptor [Chitinophagaceae bacterium]
MKYFSAFLLALLAVSSLYAQTCKLRLSGHIEDADTRERLEAATILIKETGSELISNAKGDFVFDELCPGTYSLLITHIDCDPLEKKVVLNGTVHLDLFMPHARKTMSALVVEAQKGANSSGFRRELTGRDLEYTRGFSLAEALAKINGITLLQTGSTISKPVFYGLHSNRILTINNGVRQEGQQWGNEHAPEIDPFIADKLVIIKGVDELRYGSDAIGGVILIETRPLLTVAGSRGEVNSGYFTNNGQYFVSGVFEQHLKNRPFSYRIQGTYKRSANVSTRDYRLNNTASSEQNASLTAAWKKTNFNTELFYSYFNTRLGIFIGSHKETVPDLLKAIASPAPDAVFTGQNSYTIGRPYQDVAHHLIKSKSNLYKGEHKFSFQVAGQYNHRREYDVVRSSQNKNPQLDLSIYTLSEDLSWDHPRSNYFTGTAGISAMQQDNSYRGRYFIPNYFSSTIGAYYIEKWSKHRWELQAGIRYDDKRISTTRIKVSDTLEYSFHFNTLATSFNAAYKPGVNWKVNLNVSVSGRAPQVNELLSNGIHQGAGRYERGDTSLRTEQSFNVQAGLNYENTPKTFRLDINAYTNYIDGFIYQQPKPDQPVLTSTGALVLYQFQQTNARLTGLDATAGISLMPRLEWTTKASVLYARNETLKDWLILMPSNRFTNELAYTFKDKQGFKGTVLSIEMLNVQRQNRVPDSKVFRQDYQDSPDGYMLVNSRISTTINRYHHPITFILDARNIFNKAYREYLNSMRYFTDEMGRNISLRVRVPFEKTKNSK